MPRNPKTEEASQDVSQEAQAAPTVRRLSSDTLELAPVAVTKVAPETIELAPDPEPKPAEEVQPEVVPPVTRPVSIADKPLSTMTREELIARLNAINNSTKIARPLNEASGPRPGLTERQMTQREAELARGAERNKQHAETQGMIPRPPLTALVPGRQDPLPKPSLVARTQPIEARTTDSRAEPDKEYVPDMKHGYIRLPNNPLHPDNKYIK